MDPADKARLAATMVRLQHTVKDMIWASEMPYNDPVRLRIEDAQTYVAQAILLLKQAVREG